MATDNRHNLAPQPEDIWLQQLCDRVQDYRPDSLPIEFDVIEQRLASQAQTRRRKFIVWISAAAVVAALVVSLLLIDFSVPQSSRRHQTIVKGNRATDNIDITDTVVSVRNIAQPTLAAANKVTPTMQLVVDQNAEETANKVEETALPKTEQKIEQEKPVMVVSTQAKQVATVAEVDLLVPAKHSKWDVSLYSTAVMGSTMGTPFVPHLMPEGMQGSYGLYLVGQRWHASVPINVGLNLRYRVTPKLGVETGVLYTMLAQCRTVYYSDGNNIDDKFTAHYLGVPLRVTYDWLKFGKFDLYTALGGSVSFPIASKSSIESNSGPAIVDRDKYGSSSVQWSANASVGLQYDITNDMGVYVEPGVGYYFNTTKRQTVFDDYPFCFTLQMGLRFSIGKK